ncbi:unnamed protein product [Trichobilharzia regenti]|nr:unnamed protein product [Trichobilharzia regenti]
MKALELCVYASRYLHLDRALYLLFPRHLANDTVRNSTIDLIQTLRTYLHYHIKCSKAYIQMRMRAKTLEFLKVLNRAHIEYPTSPVIKTNVNDELLSTAVSVASSPPSSAMNKFTGGITTK